MFSHGKGKKSVQITIGGKKILNKIIYPHFLNYPMQGGGVKDPAFKKKQC